MVKNELDCRRHSLAYLPNVLWPLILLSLVLTGYFLADLAKQTNFEQINLAPSLSNFFGTDNLGRDMFYRCISGLSLSVSIGIFTAFISAVIALILGSLAALGNKYMDGIITWLMDLFLGIPHILLLLLISFALGKGFLGLVLGIGFSHWMILSRIIRTEVMTVKNSVYVRVAAKLGLSKFEIFFKHIIPAIIPQFVVGTILLFPHAILHEAAVTFLGFGLSPEEPAIGIILAESMKYLSTGQWWLTLFPGALLVCTVIIFDLIGRRIKSFYQNQNLYRQGK